MRNTMRCYSMLGTIIFLTLAAAICHAERYPTYEKLKTFNLMGSWNDYSTNTGMLKIHENYLFFMPPRKVESYSSKNFIEIFDIADNANPKKVSAYSWIELGLETTETYRTYYGLDLEWPLVYATSYDGLYGFDFSDVNNPQQVFFYPYNELGIDINDDVAQAAIQVKNHIALLSIENRIYIEDKLYILDFSDIDNPILRSSLSLPVTDSNSDAEFIVRQILWNGGTHAFLSPGLQNYTPYFYKTVKPMDQPEYPHIAVINLTDLDHPASTFIQIDHAGSIFTYQNRLYVRTFDKEDTSTFEWAPFDITDPMNPEPLNDPITQNLFTAIFPDYPLQLDSSVWGDNIGVFPFDNELLNRVQNDFPGFADKLADQPAYLLQSSESRLHFLQLQQTTGIKFFKMY